MLFTVLARGYMLKKLTKPKIILLFHKGEGSMILQF